MFSRMDLLVSVLIRKQETKRCFEIARDINYKRMFLLSGNKNIRF
jgi:hypothetical protein